MVAVGLVVGAVGVTVCAWALICAVVVRRMGLDTIVQLGIGPSRSIGTLGGVELRVGALPLGAWVQTEPPHDERTSGVGAAVHAAMALGAGAGLAATGFPFGAVAWTATVLRFGHPPTGGLVRTVLHEAPWIVANPWSTALLAMFALCAWNTLYGLGLWVANARLLPTLIVVLAPLPWILWLLWLDVAG